MRKFFTIQKSNGTFITKDLLNNKIVLEWNLIKGKDLTINDIIKKAASVLVAAYTKTELHFTQTKQHFVVNDFMLKSLAPFLKESMSANDWLSFKERIHTILEQFLTMTDWISYTKEEDTTLFVTAFDKNTKEMLGIIQFIQSPTFQPGSIKAALYGVLPSAENRGIEELLMSSLFTIKKDAQRIFLHTRSSNEHLIQLYCSWGFTLFAGTIPHWTDLEYKVDRCDSLQKTAETLIRKT